MPAYPKLVKSFHDHPDNIPFKQHRFFAFTNYAFLMATMFHFTFIWVFALLDLTILSVYNIFSSILWIVCIYLNLKGTRAAHLIIADLEVLTHAALCTIVIGWQSGFHYYALSLPLVIFLSNWSTKMKIFLCGINGLAYILLFYFTHDLVPVKIIENKYLVWFGYFNMVSIFFVISFCSFYYRLMVLKVEKQLEAAHQKTIDTLMQLNESLAGAADYVKSILPDPILDGTVHLNWEFVPSQSLGGDAFGYHWLDKDHFVVYLLDVSGHGVSAALLSATITNVLRFRTLPGVDFHEPDNVLSALNQSFPSEKNNDMYFTIWYGVYNRQTRSMVYSSGGHPPALLFSASGQNTFDVFRLRTPNRIIGAFKKKAFQKDTRILKNKDCIYIFSDGVYEFLQTNGKRWSFDEFVSHMEGLHQGDEKDINRLMVNVKKLNNANLFEDDFTLLKVSFA